MAYQPTQKGIAGKLVLVILLAAFCGFIWALVDTGTSPQEFFSLLGGGPSEEPAPPPDEDPEPDPDPVRPPDPDPVRPPDPDPVRPPDPDPVQPPPPPVATEFLPIPKVEGLLKELRRNVGRGLFVKADKQIGSTKPETLPGEFRQEFDTLAGKNGTYLKLLRETRPGTNIPTPEIWRLRITGGGQFIVKKLKQREGAWSFETVQGIRSRIKDGQVSDVQKYNGYQAKAAINLELETLCNSRGIEVTKDRTEGGIRYRFVPKNNRKIPAHAYFDLADFCARNGVSERLPELFDAGLAIDPNLIQTVHEIKGDRLVDVFIYFITSRLQADAEFTYDLLKKRYADTRAFREKIDKDVLDAYNTFFEKEEPLASATAPVSSSPVIESSPASSGGGSAEIISQPDNGGSMPKSTDQTPPSERNGGTPAPPPLKGGLSLPQNTPPAVRNLVNKANSHYEKAMEHVQASNPNINPTGWAQENKKALDKLGIAWEIYNEAQNVYKNNADIPQSLLKRIREVTMMRSMCRKRAVSN